MGNTVTIRRQKGVYEFRVSYSTDNNARNYRSGWIDVKDEKGLYSAVRIAEERMGSLATIDAKPFCGKSCVRSHLRSVGVEAQL